jgi:hypothetical protein
MTSIVNVIMGGRILEVTGAGFFDGGIDISG